MVNDGMFRRHDAGVLTRHTAAELTLEIIEYQIYIQSLTFDIWHLFGSFEWVKRIRKTGYLMNTEKCHAILSSHNSYLRETWCASDCGSRKAYRAIEHTLIDIVKLLWSQLRVNKIIQSFLISIIPRLSPWSASTEKRNDKIWLSLSQIWRSEWM